MRNHGLDEGFELASEFDTSVEARCRRGVRKILDSRFLLIAVLVHAFMLIIFGGKIIFESYERVHLESESILAPGLAVTSLPPPPAPPQTPYDVKVKIPQTTKMNNRLVIDKLSADFTVAAPEIGNLVATSLGDLGSTGGDRGGGGDGTGFARVNFFGISSRASRIAFLADISGSMNKGEALGHSYDEVVRQISNGVSALTSSNEFNIITFAKTALPFQPQLVKAFGGEKGKAMSWFKKLVPGGGVNEYNGIDKLHAGTRADLALEQAIQQRPEVILFVSDGLPTGTPPADLLNKVRVWQAQNGTQIMINTVFYKTGTTESQNNRAKDFMMKLASQNNGEFKSIE